MRLSVIGAGYLGAVHATCMASLGHDVKVFDIDSAKIENLASGVPPFYEPGFTSLLQSVLKTGRLAFTDNAPDAIRGAEMHFVCVGTPQQTNGEAADLQFVNAAFRAVLDHADCPGTIVGKSTVPVGTAQRLAALVAEEPGHPDLQVGWNPEFLSEGTAITDTMKPSRLVFGVNSVEARDALIKVYDKLLKDGVPYVSTDFATSEMVKVAANSFLATKISFINAMAEICEVAGADVVTLSRALGYDKRIGAQYLNAGLGFGGGCLPKDIRAFSTRASELGVHDAVAFLRDIEKINLRRRERVVSLISNTLGESLLKKRIAILGAAFKPGSDDVRDSPALHVAAALHQRGSSVHIHDPRAIANAKLLLPMLNYCDTVEDACADADFVVLATEWKEYREIDPSVLIEIVREPNIVDARNALDYQLWTGAGWQVLALGRTNLQISDSDTN